jgi:hypothetical protein
LGYNDIPLQTKQKNGSHYDTYNRQRGERSSKTLRTVDGLETLDGTPIKWENWEMNTFATLGQTVYNDLVTNPTSPGDSIAQARNRELHFMVRKAIQSGSAFHLIEASPVDDGHSAIQALKSWYGSTDTSGTIIEHYRMKL